MSGPLVVGGVALTPEFVASAFWSLGSDDQAKFFAELNRIAGYKLCLQMAWVVADMAESGNSDAIAGFRTMFAHADDFPNAAAEWRASNAKRDIGRLTPEQEAAEANVRA